MSTKPPFGPHPLFFYVYKDSLMPTDQGGIILLETDWRELVRRVEVFYQGTNDTELSNTNDERLDEQFKGGRAIYFE